MRPASDATKPFKGLGKQRRHRGTSSFGSVLLGWQRSLRHPSRPSSRSKNSQRRLWLVACVTRTHGLSRFLRATAMRSERIGRHMPRSQLRQRATSCYWRLDPFCWATKHQRGGMVSIRSRETTQIPCSVPVLQDQGSPKCLHITLIERICYLVSLRPPEVLQVLLDNALRTRFGWCSAELLRVNKPEPVPVAGET